MPHLASGGYAPAEIPAAGEEAISKLETVGRDNPDRGTVTAANPHTPYADLGLMAPPELRIPGVQDRPAFHPLSFFTMRPGSDADNDEWTKTNGIHVAQVAGHTEPFGAMAPEPPMLGSTWRLEPKPADSGYYIGAQAAS